VASRNAVTLSNLRIGCVKYLNARPLIRGWPAPVTLDHPAALCRSLAQGELDVALVSSVEFLRNPIYQVVNGISISSAGPVYSVVVAHAGALSEITEIDLDPAAETSVNLLKCLLAESGLSPRLVRASIAPLGPDRARLLIGDQAIQFRQEHVDQFKFWDLGEQWQKLVQLPFVYALWLVRPEVANAREVADELRSLRDANLRHLDDLIAEQENPEFCGRYYREHLRFSFGAREQEGLRMFQALCEKHGLIPKRALELKLV
jgi:chorismate dehydratase